MVKLKFSLQVLLLAGFTVVSFYIFLFRSSVPLINSSTILPQLKESTVSPKIDQYNLWLIFSKSTNRSTLAYKFEHLLSNLLNISSVPLNIHVIVDNISKIVAEEIFQKNIHSLKTNRYNFYDVNEAALLIDDIVQVMSPHFSSKPGTYYSGALFYLSLGLYRFAPKNESTAVMLDCDLYFKKDISLLFDQFNSFSPSNLFGLSPELSPVYRHILTKYRLKHKTTFGDYFHSFNILNESYPSGFQGFNSGVILLNLTAIRESKEYDYLLSSDNVKKLTDKYKFKGHLGDQDFYTLLGYERPDLFKTLSCGFNRQLCTWWRDHGYSSVFKYYFKCNDPIIVLHGNCHSKITIS